MALGWRERAEVTDVLCRALHIYSEQEIGQLLRAAG